MTPTRRILAGVALALAAGSAMATYPDRPIRFIVPMAAGGPADQTARLLARMISDQLGQPVVVDNRSGAGGVAGTDVIAKAAPDGYTIGMGTISSFGINPGLMAKMPFDAQKDFTPIGNASATSGIILATRDAPFKDLPGLVAYARQNPGKVTYASAGIGSVGHMVGESLNHTAGIALTHVPYRGTTPAAQGLLAGDVMLFIETSFSTAMQYLPTGRIKAIAVTRKQRSPLLPDVPSMGEGGFPQIDSPAWFGVVGPAGMPPDVVKQLNAILQKGFGTPEAREQLARFGAEPVPSTPEDFRTYIGEEIGRWTRVIRAAGIKPE